MIAQDKKTRSLILIIFFLLITNLVLLSVFVFSKNAAPPGRGLNLVGTFLKDSIGFNSKQMEKYQQVRKADYEKGLPVFDSIKMAKTAFYLNISRQNAVDTDVNKLALEIGSRQANVDKHMLYHFRNLRNICTPQQLPKFDSLIINVVQQVTSARYKSHSK